LRSKAAVPASASTFGFFGSSACACAIKRDGSPAKLRWLAIAIEKAWSTISVASLGRNCEARAKASLAWP
jgi:hypothetical protein